MAAIVTGENETPAWLAGLGATARDKGQRAVACAAAVVMTCAVGEALLELVAQVLSFPAPVAVTAITLMAAALRTSLRRHLRTRGQAPTRPRRPA